MAISYSPREWADGSSGGTPIDAASLNRMESGIANAVAGVNQLNEAGNVTTDDIAAAAVSTDKIADGAVTSAKLAQAVRDSISQAQSTASSAKSAAGAAQGAVNALPKIRHGVATDIGGTAGTTVYRHVNLSGFSQVPAVVACPQSTSPDSCSVAVSNVTTTGFDIRLYRTNTADTDVFWIAIGS